MEFCGEDDCYQVLNITSDSTRGEVKRGYHKMSLLYHPDKLGDKSEEEQAAGNALFIKVAQAYAVLSDEGSRRKYDMWVRGGRKRRPEPGDDMGPMPAYYRDDSVRDVQDTPVAFAAVAVTLLISIGLPFCLTMQGKGKRTRRPQVEKKEKSGEEAVPHVSRRERRGERENRDPSSHFTPHTADISAVTTTQDTGIHSMSTTSKKPAITKVSGPWSPEEEAELIKAVAKFPGGTVERWAKIADWIGSRSEEDCMARAAALKGIAHHRTGGGGWAGGGGTQKADARSAYNASQSQSGGGGGFKDVKTSREDLAKMSVTEFAKLVKEKEREKSEKEKDKEKEREREKGKDKSKDRGKATGADEKSEDKAHDKPWTPAEQSLLENAMRTVDKSLADRWDRIAEMVPNRSRKEVVARVKDLKKMLAASAQE